MEFIIAAVGGMTMYSLIRPVKENFEETYFDSDNYYKQSNDNPQITSEINRFSPSESQSRKVEYVRGDTNPYVNDATDVYGAPGYPINNDPVLPQHQFIEQNSLYNKDVIRGIPIKDYYEKYTKDVLEGGSWFLNQDMPQGTKQYQDDSQIQRRMEMFTGLDQKNVRAELGVPNKQETLNLFTPQERITGYGYQYGQSSSGPGLSITRSKELEHLSKEIKFKTNEQPFEKIIVGKGLALGTEVPAAGGFQEFTRILPSNISDYSANQLPGRVAGGKWVYSNAPTSQQPVVKNRPNGYYSLCQRGPATGKSTFTAPTTRSDYAVLLKNTNREFINYGFGSPLSKLGS
jgi:hypothetical protein